MNVDNVYAAVRFSDIRYEFGYRTSIFKNLYADGIQKVIFTTILDGKVSDNLSLELVEAMREVIKSCKKSNITPLFAFLMPTQYYDELMPKIVIPKDLVSMLSMLCRASKCYYRDVFLSDINMLLKDSRSSFLIGENFAHYQYSPRVYRPFSFEYTKGADAFSKMGLKNDSQLYEESEVKKYDFFYYTDDNTQLRIGEISRKEIFCRKCKETEYPFVLLDYCYDSYIGKYHSVLQLSNYDNYGSANFKDYIFNYSMEWLFSQVDIDYEKLYNEIKEM